MTVAIEREPLEEDDVPGRELDEHGVLSRA